MKQVTRVVYIAEDSTEYDTPMEALGSDLRLYYNEAIRRADIRFDGPDDLIRLVFLNPKILETLKHMLWYHSQQEGKSCEKV